MTHSIRPVTDGERRAARAVLSRSLLRPPATDEQWARVADYWVTERKFGAFDGPDIIGIASSFGTEMMVPGGALLPVAAVDGVAVRSDHTRRGVFTALMRTQLADLRDRGEALALLHASEPVIYGRAGYGAALRRRSLVFDVRVARIAPRVPLSGTVRLITGEEALTVLPGLYRGIAPNRHGMLVRSGLWWIGEHARQANDTDELTFAVHRGPDGDDGFVVYRTQDRRGPDDPDRGGAVLVRDMCAADPAALAGLWRHLLGVDLVSEVFALARPMDDPIDAMLSDPRGCRTRDVGDHGWLRLVDVEAALAGRSWGQATPVVVGVRDEMLPHNERAYRVGPDGVEITDRPAQLVLDAEALAMLYLGDRSPSDLAAVGRVHADDPSALAAADTLFATTRPPWCGTGF